VKLRPYQSDLKVGIDSVWEQGGTPIGVLPTGAGKTVVFARILAEHDGAAVVIAHRRELVGQISLALAREGVTHRIIAPNTTIRAIVRQNTEELGRSYYSPAADIAVASVDSIRRAPEKWRERVTLWVIDEGHHVLRANKWGKALALFPNAKGLGVTATPERADRKGLGRHASGIFTALVVGPSMRELIDAGHLSDYRIFAPPSSLDTSQIAISKATGDYSVHDMQTAVSKAHITGDVVEHYIRLAYGKLGVTFAVSIREAEILAEAFRQAGVPAAAVSSKTPGPERVEMIRRFRNRELLQLVNVDIFGEGFDLPAIEVVSFARPTMSFPLFCQSFGRALRPMPGKEYATVIDHVGNVAAHGLPDAYRTYSLDSREAKTAHLTLDSVKACPHCARVYRRVHVECPYCNHVPIPVERGTPEQVDGDLVELDAATLEAMRNAVSRVDMDPEEYARELNRRGCPQIGIAANKKRHIATQDAQHRLRHILDWWRGVKQTEGLSERESFKAFYLEFHVDVLSARSLPAKDADALCERVRSTLPFAARCMTS
jgi:superfamily II DNA or RNA helicase